MIKIRKTRYLSQSALKVLKSSKQDKLLVPGYDGTPAEIVCTLELLTKRKFWLLVLSFLVLFKHALHVARTKPPENVLQIAITDF